MKSRRLTSGDHDGLSTVPMLTLDVRSTWGDVKILPRTVAAVFARRDR